MKKVMLIMAVVALVAAAFVGCRTTVSVDPITGAPTGAVTDIDPCGVAKHIDIGLAAAKTVVDVVAPHVPAPWKPYAGLVGTIVFALASVWQGVKKMKIIRGAKAAALQLNRLKKNPDVKFDDTMAIALKTAENAGAIMPDNL